MESSTQTAATETPQEKVSFHSEASNYRIIIDPSRRRQIGESNESEIVPGKAIQFYDGVYATSDPEEIAFLRDSDSNGKYFWEVGSAQDVPEDAAGLLKEIIEKSLEGDFDRIADILVAERSGTSRAAVITACEAAITAGSQNLPARPATPLHEVQRVRVGPTAGATPGVSPDPVAGTPLVDPSMLSQPPGAPAVPGDTSVPVGQVPAEEASGDVQGTTAPEIASTTVPSASGPLVTGDPALEGAAPIEPTGEPVGSPESDDGGSAEVEAAAPGAPAAPEEETGNPPTSSDE